MRSKRRIFAWLLTVVMVLSLVSNQYMIVTKAEESSTAYSIAEALALESTKEVVVDGEATSVEVNKVAVSLPRNCYDFETGADYVQWDDISATLYKVIVPAYSAVKLVYEYTGELIDGSDGLCSYEVSVYNTDELKYVSSIVNTTDATQGLPSQSFIVENNTSTEVAYLITLNTDVSDVTALRATSPVSYTKATEIEISEGDIQITGDSCLIEYPINDMMLGITNAYKDGYMYKLNVPQDGQYCFELKYKGDTMMYGVVNFDAYQQVSDDMGQYSLLCNSSGSISAAMPENSISLNSGENYIFLSGDSDEWANLNYSISKLETIAALKDSAIPVTDIGEYDGKVSDDSYLVDGYFSSKGTLYSFDLAPNTGYLVSSNGQVYLMTSEDLGTGYYYSGYEPYAVYNGYLEEKTYYAWLPEGYDVNGEVNSLIVENIKFISDCETTEISSNVTDYNIVLGDTCATALLYCSDMYGNSYDSASTYIGNIYSFELPAYSKYMLKLDYVGEEYVDDYCTISSNVNVVVGNYVNNSLSVSNQHDTWSDYYYNTSTTALDNSNNGSSQTVYLVADGQWEEGDIQLSIYPFPNITQLMEKAQDITGETSYTGTISDTSYEYVYDWSGNKTDSRGGLQKVTVPAGKTKTYNLSSGFNGVIYKEVDGELIYDSQIYGTRFNITNDNYSSEETVYYIWVYTYDYGVTSYDITPVQEIINYRTHVQSYGWQNWCVNGALAGTVGRAKRLEAIQIMMVDDSVSGGVRYTANVQSYGWLGDLEDQSTWNKDGEMCGTAGQQKRLEAICIDLYGEMAEHYDIYYRVHAQSYGWLNWASNGAPAGTAGYAKRLEGIQIVVVPKGETPTSDYGGIISARNESFIDRGLPTISQLTASATDASKVDSYEVPVTDKAYYHNNYTQSSVGALLKLVVPAGEIRVVDGVGVYSYFVGYVYEEANIDGYYNNSASGNRIAVGNSTDQEQTYYVWISAQSDNYGELQPVTVEVNSIPMVSEGATIGLTLGQATKISADKKKFGFLYESYSGYHLFYGTAILEGAAYYVDVPANSTRVVNLEYVGETVPGYFEADYVASIIECYVQDSDCVKKAILEVSKYSDIPNYEAGGTGRTKASYTLENNTNETARYYFMVTDVENADDVELSVNEIKPIETLIDSALDISEYGTYEGEFSSEKYAISYFDDTRTSTGRLAKLTVKPGQKVDVYFGSNISAYEYKYVNGKLEFVSSILNGLYIITNTEDQDVTYYYWIHSGYEDIKSFAATTSESFYRKLSAYADSAKELKEGKNTLGKGDELVGVEMHYEGPWNEELGAPDEYVRNEKGYVYKFTVPALSKVTFDLSTVGEDSVVGPYIYGGFDKQLYTTQLSYWYGNIYNSNSYTAYNTTKEPKTMALYMSFYSGTENCDVTITTESIVPEDDELIIYSWNNEISSIISGILDAYPEYKEKVKCVSFELDGLSDEYINNIKSISENTKESNSVIFVADIGIVDKLKSESNFANLKDIGFDVESYENAYDYNVEMGSYNDELKFLSYDANPGGFIYDMNIAKEVLGTDDPKEVQELIGSPEKFLTVAQQMKEAGYYMTSGEDTITTLGKYTFNEDEASKLSSSLTAGGYTTGNSSWSVAWYEDMTSGKVFGFFGSPWYVYWVYEYSDIPVAICEGPIYYPWGGCYLGVSSDGDNANDQLAADFLELLCCDEEVMYKNTSAYVSKVNGGVVFPNNQKVVERLIADGYGMTTEYVEEATLSNNPLPIWHNAANRIGKGEWESKCTDRKYIINIDSKKQINLTPESETGKALMEAGFVYENFTKIADVNGNATFDATTGVLTVSDVKEVVRYIYTENGVSRELQFIACMEEDTSVTVKEDVVVDEAKGETTTTYVEVDAEKGEIVGQIDEVEVKTEDENTTIVVTENKDAVGEVVKDASITVSQETISESTLDQSIEVAATKNEAYAQAAEENESIQDKVEIKEIKAEFKDDSANTEVSKDLINKLQDNDMSLEISKKNDKGDVEYSWHFDRHSMKDVDKENVKPVNTKVTIHTDNDLKDYDKDKKDHIDKLTKKDDSEKPIEKSVIAFDHNGELPGKTTVTLNVGDKYEEGSYVYYYHYDESDKDNPKLVPKGRGKVENGYVPVRIDHCSDYVITNEVLAKAESATLSIGSETLGETVDMETGTTAKLVCTVAPEAAMQEVTYFSSDSRILTVDANGNIKAVSTGTATITAAVNDDSGVTVMVTITVKDPIILVSNITLDKNEIELEGGETATLVAQIAPENVTDKTVTWSSEDESIATVDATGKVTALKEGTTTITVASNDEAKKSASCQVTVTKSIIEVTELTLDSTAVELEEGEDVTFTVTVLPEDATIKDVTWSSDDESVATVDATGKVTAVKAGEATITATATDGSGKTVSCTVTVKEPIILVSEIKLDNESLSLEEGASKTITASVKPLNVTDKTITWKSSDESVATVDVTGKVTAVKAGEATITATAADGSKVTAECKVTVSKKVVYATELSISKTSLSLVEGETSTLTAKIVPDNATNKAVNWSSNNTSVATVDKDGKITAVKAGFVLITATAADGSGKTASCKLTVVEPEPPAIDVYYRTHIQSFGWEGEADKLDTWKVNGAMSGTSGKAKRLEGIEIEVASAEAGKSVDLEIQYTTHCQSYGWLPWSTAGEMSGTSGEAKRLEAIMIKLTGADADKYDVYYRVHAQSYGWLAWASNGEPSGTAGYGKRLEGIQIVVVKKGDKPSDTFEGVTSTNKKAYEAKSGSSPVLGQKATDALKPVVNGADAPYVMYKTHVQSYGWQQWVLNGAMSGTEGKAKRLEGINIKLSNMPYDGDIVYTTHVQSYGWQGKEDNQSTWKKNGEMSGTSGEAKRLEAIRINLTGELAEHYDIYYRVHAQSYGWLGWAKNGEASGTAGYSKRLEGIQIVLVPKGGAAPADNYGGIKTQNDKPYISKK